MDNNLNGNFSGIPNVDDIKVDDTPAESFENLYGNNVNNSSDSMQTNVAGVNDVDILDSDVVDVPQSNNTNINFINNVQSNSNVDGLSNNVSNVSQNLSTTSVDQNMGFQNSSVQMPDSLNNVSNVSQNVGTTSVDQNMGFQNSSVQMPDSLNNVSNVSQNVSTTSFNQNMMNSGVVADQSLQRNEINNQGRASIDDEKMKSIEEQLSKTCQYNPDDFQQEMISIPDDIPDDQSKSGLTFVLILFVILGVTIMLLPKITSLVK